MSLRKAQRGQGRPGKPVLCVDTGVVYADARDAEARTGVNHASINRNCNGRIGSAGGRKWRFVKEEE